MHEVVREDETLTERVARYLGANSPGYGAVPGWAHRESQASMGAAVALRMEEGGVLVVEAPTGVGKTLAYLLPALLGRQKVIVSTNTKALQDQIVDKDLPLAATLLAHDRITIRRSSCTAGTSGERREPNLVEYAVMKGRSNYLCLDRLDRRQQQAAFDFGDGALTKIARWASETERGDRAELGWLSESSTLWDELDARSEICSGTKCPRYDDCFVHRMRREAENADVVIVNHHLLLADLALKAEQSLTSAGRTFGAVVPDADVLIVDEAHAIEETASEYFGGQVSTRMLDQLGKDVHAFAEGRRDRPDLDALWGRAAHEAGAIFDAAPEADGRTRWAERLPNASRDRDKDKDKASKAFEALAEFLETSVGSEGEGEGLARRARQIGQSLTFVVQGDDPDFVYWSERRAKSVSLGASPIVVADLLRRFMYPRFETTVMTSATLSTGEASCAFFRKSVGAPDDTTTHVLSSPFDFSTQAALFLPSYSRSPDDARALLDVIETGYDLISMTGGGALFLFTSHRVMRAAHAALVSRLPYPVLLQGEMPKRMLVRAFVEQAPAVLFATASFWEGIDVPGDPLRLVLIDRLPFDAPNDPVVSARASRIEAEGGSGFTMYQLPRAILRLKQGFGRLIRSSADLGIVAILDPRLRTRGYGKRILRALPEAQVFEDRALLGLWWAEKKARD